MEQNPDRDSQNSIDAKLKLREEEIREAAKKVERLTEPHWLPGQENKIAIFPQAKDLPVLIAFSIGSESKNMSAKYIDEAKGETKEGNEQNVRDFHDAVGFAKDSYVVHLVPNMKGTQWQIDEIVSDPEADPNEDNRQDANFVIVREPENPDDPPVLMDIKPGDCPIYILVGKDKFGGNFVAVYHGGHDAINAGLGRQGAEFLKDEMGVDLSTVKVFGVPGNGRQHHFITNEPERRGNGIVERNWGEDNIDPVDQSLTEEERHAQKRRVDMHGASVMQFQEAGIKPENIEIYDMDAYTEAEAGRLYSLRFTSENGGKRNGRFLVSIQLKKDSSSQSNSSMGAFTKAA